VGAGAFGCRGRCAAAHCPAEVPHGDYGKDNGMKKLPNAVKWLIILVVLGAMGAMMWAVNDRASRVEMPAPDNTFGIYHTAESGT
jgi:hypothetical protein